MRVPGSAVGETFAVAEHRGIVGDFDEDGAVRVGDALHEHGDGERGGDEDALEQTPEESRGRRRGRGGSRAYPSPRGRELAEIHEGGDGDDDNRRQDRFGEIGEQRVSTRTVTIIPMAVTMEANVDFAPAW